MAGHEVPAQRGKWEDELRITLLNPAQTRVLGMALTMRLARLDADGETPEPDERKFTTGALFADRLGGSFPIEWRPVDGYAETIRDELGQFRHTLAAAQAASILYSHHRDPRLDKDMKIAGDMIAVFDEMAQIHDLVNEFQNLDL